MIGAALEAQDVLQKYGPGTDRKINLDWLHVPRESFDAGGWDEKVGKENVESDKSSYLFFHNSISLWNSHSKRTK